MPTKKPRITVSFDLELFEKILKRAKTERRNASNLCALLVEIAMSEWCEPASPQHIEPQLDKKTLPPIPITDRDGSVLKSE